MKISRQFSIAVAFLLVLFGSSLMLYYIYMASAQYKALSYESLIQEAKAHYLNMLNTRLWNSNHGSVYAKVKKDFQPNPYLKDNVLYTKDNEKLVRINPAFMTREISDISNANSDYFFKITSLKPLNPHNVPDSFEKEALESFEKKQDEKYYYKIDEEKNYFYFMGALKVEESCLECHSHQGYKVGDNRGGLRISVPTKIHDEQVALVESKSKKLTIMTIVLSIFVIFVFRYFINMIFARQKEIETLNKNLEIKVQERTQNLENLYENEKYLKDLSYMESDINDILLRTHNVDKMLIDCVDRLSQYPKYVYICGGLLKGNIIDINCSSNILGSVIKEDFYDFDKDITDQEILKIKQCIEDEQKIIEKLHSDDIESNWVMYLPFVIRDKKGAYGAICIYANVENGFENEEIELLEKVVADITLAIHTEKQKQNIDKMEQAKIDNYEETILAFVNIIEQRDTYTAGHTQRVADYCKMIALNMGISIEDIIKLERAAILHDIGKIATPDAILLKPTSLTSLEYELIKLHSESGYEMLSKIEMYKELAVIIRYHHSRYDGSGYPATFSRDEVPLLSHILIVADAFDAMTTNRIYRARKSVDEALDELKKFSGEQFHPLVVESALESLKDIKLEQVNQLPTSEIEKKRFSYFFQDQLTGLYNESYLRMILKNEDNGLNYLYHIELHNFAEFNKANSWNEGNKKLVEITEVIQKNYKKEHIFRFQGDDFIILDKNKVDLQDIIDNINDLLKGTSMEIKLNEYDLKDQDISIESLKY